MSSLSIRSLIHASAAATLVLVAATGALAQGRGRGLGHKGTTPSATASTTAAIAAGTPVGFRQFGSWLDDASVVDPGTTWLALSFGHYRSLGGNQSDFPVADATIGLSRRAQFGITVPHYSMSFPDGTAVGGLGDIYANVKIGLPGVGNESNPVRFAMTPIVEIIQDPVPGTNRLSWGLPFNLEFHPGKVRVFGSTGFFSRGAVFGSGALEIPARERLLITTSLSYTRSVKDDAGADALGLAKNRGDVSVSAAYFLTPVIAVFGGTGRTLSNADGSGTSVMLNGGISLTFAPHAAGGPTTPARRP
jgi:hypothetical protein